MYLLSIFQKGSIIFPTAFLLTVLILVTGCLIITLELTLDKDFLLEAFDRTDFYRRFDEKYIASELLERRDQGTFYYILFQINTELVLRENADAIVQDTVDYMKGHNQRVNPDIQLSGLESELKGLLGDFDSFMAILQREAPNEARLLMSLPRDMQITLHHVFKASLLESIHLPDKIPLTALVDEGEIHKPLTGVRSMIQIVYAVSTIALPTLMVLMLIVFALGQKKAFLYGVGWSLLTVGVGIVGVLTFMAPGQLLSLTLDLDDPLVIDIIAESTLSVTRTVGIGYVIAGFCLLLLLKIITRLRKRGPTFPS